MRKIEIQFPNHQVPCVFPDGSECLPRAISKLDLGGWHLVIVLIGGFIPGEYARTTQKAVDVIAGFAEEHRALIICGGSAIGVMAAIGKTRLANRYKFPLLGINLENLVTWPKGPRRGRFLWWGTQRYPLAAGYSHFILVPGGHYGEDSPWIAEAAAYLSRGNKSITILVNGGNVSRKDVTLSLENGRPIIALAGTGRLADEIASDPNRPALVFTVEAKDENALLESIQTQLEVEGKQVYHDSHHS